MSAEESSSENRRSRFAWARTALLSLLACLAALFFVVDLPPVRRAVLGYVVETISESQGLLLEAEELDYNLAVARIHLESPSLRAAGAEDLPALFSADRLTLDFRLWRLIFGDLVLEEGVVDGVRIEAVTTADGRSNLPEPQESGGSGPSLVIERFRASGPLLRYADGEKDVEVRIPQWRAAIDGPDRLRAAFSTEGPGAVTWEGRALDVGDLAFAVAGDPSRVEIERATASVGAVAFTAEGAVDDPLDEPELDVMARVSGPVLELAQLAGVESPIDGRLDIESRLTNTIADLQAQTTGDLAGWTYGGLPAADTHFEVHWTRGQDELDLAALTVDAPYGNASVEGRAALEDSAGATELQLTWSNVRLAPLAGEFDAEVVPEAAASGSGSVRFPGLGWEQAQVDLSARLRPTLDRPAPGRLPLSGGVRASGGLNAGSVSTRGLTAFQTTLSGQARIGADRSLAGRFDLALSDAAATAAEVDGWLARESAADVGGAIDGTIDLSGSLDAPAVDLALRSDNLRYDGFEEIALTTEARADTNAVEIRTLRAAWNGQSFDVTGRVGLEGESPTLDLLADVDAVELADVLAATGSDLQLSGEADATARIGGTVEIPDATFNAVVANLVAYDEPLGQLDMAGTLADGALKLSTAELVRENDAVLVAGATYQVETGAFEFDLGGPGIALTQFRPTPDQVVTGLIQPKARGSGTAEDPKVEWSLRAEDLRLDEQEIGAVDLSGVFTAEQATAQFELPKWKLSGDAEAALDETSAAKVEARIDDLDLSTLDYEFHEGAPLTGGVQASLTAEGAVGEWEAWHATATVGRFVAEAAGQRIETEGEARFRYADGVVEVERLAVSSGDSALNVSGDLPLDREQDGLELRLAGGLDLAPLPVLLGRNYDEAFADGVLQLDGSVRGSLDEPRPRLDVKLAGGTLFLPETMRPLLDVDLTASVDPSKITVENFGGEWAGATIALVAEAPFEGLEAGEGDVHASGTVEGLNLGAFEQAPDELSGALDLSFEATAAEPTLDALQATATATRLELNYRDLTIAQQQPTELAVRDSTLQIQTLDWKGPQLSVTASGEASLEEGGQWDLSFEGSGDAAISTLVVDDVVAAGPFEMQGRFAGPLDDPQLSGTFALNDGRVSFDDYGLDAVGLDARLAMTDDRFTIERLSGEFNGGTLEASGGLRWADGQPSEVDLALTTREVYMDFPEGLRSVSRADLRAWSTADDFVMLGGEVVVEDGSMRERLDLESEVLTFLGSDGLELPGERDPVLARIRYNVGLRTANPILVDNNLARLEAEANLRLVGTYYRPALVGRMTLDEGGEVYLAENEYVIERGAVDFTSETRLRPSLNLTARTQVAGHEITLRALGNPDELDTQFTSDTGLSEPDILSVLLTGRTLEEAQEAGFNVAREQALSYLTGRLGGRISSAAERSLGLSRVRIEPNLIAAEENPTARLTVGQQLTRRLELIYSMDLTDSNDQIIVTEYDVTRMFSTRGVRTAENDYRFDFRHDVRFGLGDQRPERRARERKTIGTIAVSGELRLPEEVVRERIDLEEGKRYDFFRARKQVDRLERLYREDGRLESRIRLRRQEKNGVVDLRFEIDGGPQVELIYEGADPPSGVRDEVRELWARGVFGEQRARDARSRVLRWLDGDQRYGATVRTEITDLTEDERRVLIEVQPGARYNALELAFNGAEAITPDELRGVLEQTNLLDRVRGERREVADTLKRYYAVRGRLEAEVEAPKISLDESTGEARATIAIQEGPLYRVGKLTFTGAEAVEESALRKVVTPTEDVRPYEPRFLDEALENIEEAYWERGYNDVLVEFRLTRVQEDPRVDVEFVLTENKQDVVRAIEVAGNRNVGEKLIERRLLAEEGKPLLNEESDKSRRRLYDTGAFALVDLESESMPGIESAPGVDAVKLTATVREVSPFKLRYGAFFDTERGPGFIADFENRNSLGAARVAGLRARYDADFREARAYFGQPLLVGRPINSTAALFRSRELRDAFITDRTGASLQQEIQFNRKWLLNYGWRFERARTFDRNPEDVFIPFDQTIDVAPLQTTLSFDSRDELLDATRGRFFSSALEFAPASLGSDVRFIKYFGQLFEYHSFFRPEPDPFSRTQGRPRLTWASGLRVGLQDGLGGQDIVFSERFFAGGGTTIRGFRQDRVGPQDFFGDPAGGEAVFVLNQEARFPVIGPFEGVGFVDVGNVYERWDDFSLGDLRKAGGLGLRVRTPFFLLRVDYGLKLDRRDGERRGAWFFSIGQAF